MLMGETLSSCRPLPPQVINALRVLQVDFKVMHRGAPHTGSLTLVAEVSSVCVHV